MQMPSFLEILFSVEFWKIAAPAAFAVVAWYCNERKKREWEQWQLKKAACLKALNIANAVISNYRFENVNEEDIKPQYASTEDIRACFNELACTCDQPDVLNGLKKILFEPIRPDEIVDLRTAVRKELGFKGETIDSDRNRAFIGKVCCEKPNNSQPI